MTEWKKATRTWHPTWRQRIKKAWGVLRTGTYTFEMSYKFQEAGGRTTVFLEGEKIMEFEDGS